ncbi:MAG: FkbM family methyltransferase [Fluviicola sp.]|nr:FkbM family methyltransferase [Fluviicola sp.]
MSVPNRSFLLRHRFISTLRDMDVKGIRRLSVVLPKVLLPAVERAGKLIIQTLHGVKLLIDPAKDKGVELALYQTGTYEKGTIQLLGDFLKKGSVFMDIGANIGLMSTIASKIVGEKGRVYAVEANPKTIEVLRHNCAINQCENIEILPIALASEKGSAILYENWNVNRGGASLISQGDEHGITVSKERLDDLFSQDSPVHLVKIDVEGFELEVLKGGVAWFKTQQPVFIIEVSTQRSNQEGATPESIMSFVAELGNYSFFKQKGTKERRGKLVSVTSAQDLPEHDNLIAIPLKRI